MAASAVWACGVCDEVMQARTPSIACTSCRNWVHLKKCAGLSGLEAKKNRTTFSCSKCLNAKVNYFI